MRFTENRKLAFAVLALCVLVSLFGFGGMGLARERGKVLTVFDRGADTSLSVRSSMDAYLDSCAEEAQLMASEAELHLGASQKTEKVAQLAAVVADSEMNARYEAYTDLKAAVENLYSDMLTQYTEADKEAKNFLNAYHNFQGKSDKIKHDEYHGLAADYNSLIDSFPGGIVAGVVGQGALNTFGG